MKSMIPHLHVLRRKHSKRMHYLIGIAMTQRRTEIPYMWQLLSTLEQNRNIDSRIELH